MVSLYGRTDYGKEEVLAEARVAVLSGVAQELLEGEA